MMKIEKIISASFLCLSLLLIACTDESETQTIENPINEINNDAILFQFGEQTFTDSFPLEFRIPEGIFSTGAWEPRTNLVFFKSIHADEYNWFSVPHVNEDKDFKIYYNYIKYSSNSSDIEMQLIAEEFDSSAPNINNLNFKDIRIVSVKTSMLNGLTREDLDITDYDAIIGYFNLNEN